MVFVKFRTSWSRRAERLQQSLPDGSLVTSTECLVILFIAVESFIANSMFLISWFKRKSIIMEMLKRFMWKAPMRNLYHLKILTGLRS